MFYKTDPPKNWNSDSKYYFIVIKRGLRAPKPSSKVRRRGAECPELLVMYILINMSMLNINIAHIMCIFATPVRLNCCLLSSHPLALIPLSTGVLMKKHTTIFPGTWHCEIRSLNKGYFRFRMLFRPYIKDIYCNILKEYIPLITDLNSMRLKCYSLKKILQEIYS